MRSIVNKEEIRREWVIEKWYEKVIYVVGVFSLVFFLIGFFIGFFSSL